MSVGERFAFLQFSDSAVNAISTAPVTITVALGAQPDPTVRIVNTGTATVWIGIGTRSTSSAAITTKGIMVPPASVFGSTVFIRTGGNLTLAACTVGATQTTTIITTGGEGGR